MAGTPEMEAAAERAKQDLENLESEAVLRVAEWWQKWYLKTPEGEPGAGHKNLGRILVSIAKEQGG